MVSFLIRSCASMRPAQSPACPANHRESNTTAPKMGDVGAQAKLLASAPNGGVPPEVQLYANSPRIPKCHGVYSTAVSALTTSLLVASGKGRRNPGTSDCPAGHPVLSGTILIKPLMGSRHASVASGKDCCRSFP